ncbi:DoxX family protein [Methylovirgula sp. 4M-Z18]|uniref:DoxX family protein n=1 Tax=Methylovirgula sp. 4M-Z18 TaxID=2293567 RepID=UPI000E2EC4F2|nr:DoxX family protein [Methylovirgula sp. 4M-Z18]RFB78593.1 DoxX family protein [Methylovirgula sp. 4M-Z18]
MNNVFLLIGRILLSVLFIVSGAGKFGAFAGPLSGMLGNLGLPAPLLLTYLIALCEVVGGIAVAIGYQTRIVGILLAVWCVLTGVVVHGGDPVELMKNIGLAGGFLVLAATSPGSIAYYGTWPERRDLSTSTP